MKCFEQVGDCYSLLFGFSMHHKEASLLLKPELVEAKVPSGCESSHCYHTWLQLLLLITDYSDVTLRSKSNELKSLILTCLFAYVGTAGVRAMSVSDQRQTASPGRLVCDGLTPANAPAQGQSSLHIQARTHPEVLLGVPPFCSSSQNHRMFWVGRGLKDRSVPTSLFCRDQSRSTLGRRADTR